MTNKTIISQKNKEKDFYRNRISHLTEQLLSNNEVDGLFTDVTFAFENYVKTCIHYFKIIDESDIIQNDYNGLACKVENADNNEDNEEDDDEDASGEGAEDDAEEYEDGCENEDGDEDTDGCEDIDEDLDEDDCDDEMIDLKSKKEEIYVEVLEDDDDDENKEGETKGLDDNKMKMMRHSAKMMTGTLDKFMMLKQPTPTLRPAKKCADVLPTQKEINLENPELMNKGICKKKNVNNKYGK